MRWLVRFASVSYGSTWNRIRRNVNGIEQIELLIAELKEVRLNLDMPAAGIFDGMGVDREKRVMDALIALAGLTEKLLRANNADASFHDPLHSWLEPPYSGL